MSDFIQRVFDTLNRKGDGDMVDRFSATTTVTILIVAAVVVSAQQNVRQSIDCWSPAEMTEAMAQYVDNYCLVQNTYFVPLDKPIKTSSIKFKPDRVVSYYQWVPFILLLQAVLFYAPRLVWRVASGISGVNFNGMHTMAGQCLGCICNSRNNHYKALADYVHWSLDLHRSARRRSSTRNVFDRHCNVYLIVVFLFTKLLYVVNAFGQIFLLDALLQTRDPFYGVNLVRQLINGTEWKQSGFFPRSTMCDFDIHDLGNIRRYTVQCALMNNFFHEKLFVFLWFWTMAVAIASATSLVVWTVFIVLPGNRRRFVRSLLPELPSEKQHRLVESFSTFVDRYLSVDGVFFLRSLNDQVGSIVASKVTTMLWQDFVDEYHPSGDNETRNESIADQRESNRSVIDQGKSIRSTSDHVRNQETANVRQRWQQQEQLQQQSKAKRDRKMMAMV